MCLMRIHTFLFLIDINAVRENHKSFTNLFLRDR